VGVAASGDLDGAVATVLVSGLAVLGASFLLAWGAETAEKDVPRGFAIAVLAVIAVAPEYAVDALYAWNAGIGGATTASCAEVGREAIRVASEGQGSAIAEACHDANLAVANMTGANRILIGIGWAGIAGYTVWQSLRTGDPAVMHRDGVLADAVTIDRGIALEIVFLLMATAWAFTVPLGGGIDALDTAVLVGIYVTYIAIVIRSGMDHSERHVGVPAYLQSWRRPRRIAAVLFLFLYSGGLILTAVEPFAHGLERIGLAVGLPEFFMIQWIAPLASEAPELIVVLVLVNKARSTAGFNTLISSKLNQWTLLIGTLAVVYSIAHGGIGTVPFDEKQAAEIWITAAQSLFAVGILVNFSISLREALALFGLFASQVIAEFVVLRVLALPNPEAVSLLLLHAYTVVYVVLAGALLVRRRAALADIVGFVTDAARAAVKGADPPDIDGQSAD
jgi:cation:H+ antiporter